MADVQGPLAGFYAGQAQEANIADAQALTQMRRLANIQSQLAIQDKLRESEVIAKRFGGAGYSPSPSVTGSTAASSNGVGTGVSATDPGVGTVAGGTAGGTAGVPGTGFPDVASNPLRATQGYFDSMFGLAQDFARAGLTDRSGQLMTQLTTQLEHVSATADNQFKMRKSALDMAHEQASAANQLTVGIKDQASFDRAKIQYLNDNPGAPLPQWMYLPYDQAKPYIEQIRNSSTEGMAAAKTAAQTLEANQAAAKDRVQATLASTQAAINGYELKYLKAQEDAAKKAGQPTPDPKAHAAGVKVTAQERTNTQQVIQSANELWRGFNDILALPPGTTTGTFADVAASRDPTFVGATKKWLANSITDDNMQFYVSRLAGVNMAAATIAMGGRKPSLSQAQAEKEAVQALSGQSNIVAIDKINQGSKKALAALEVVEPGDDTQRNTIAVTTRRLRGLVDQTDAAIAKAKGLKPPPTVGTVVDHGGKKYRYLGGEDASQRNNWEEVQ